MMAFLVCGRVKQWLSECSCIEDQQLLRLGVQSLLDALSPIELVGHYATLAEARRQMALLRPEVVILGAGQAGAPDPNFMSTLGALKPPAGLVIYTHPRDFEVYCRWLVLGAHACALTTELAGESLDALLATARGERWFSSGCRALLKNDASFPSQELELTKRERQALALLLAGLSNAQIAERMGLAPQTVKNYLSSIYQKLGVADRQQAILYLAQRGYLPRGYRLSRRERPTHTELREN